MSIQKQIKNLRGRTNSTKIVTQYVVPYSIGDTSRYKHIDELLLIDGTTIKATLGPVDMSVYPYDGITMYTVSESDENRIDIIATKTLGSASLYWIICYMNNIADPLDIPIGKILYIPTMSSLRQFPNPLS